MTLRLVFAGRALTSTRVVAVVLAILAWPVDTLSRPESVLAGSWPTALILAAHHHLHWGPDIAYTYGPLGFLRRPLVYFAGTTRLALLYIAVTQLALSASLLWVLRQAFGVIAAVVLTLAALCLVPDERAAAAVFVWAVIALRNDAPRALRRSFGPAIACLAALEMLVKFNSGVAVLAIGVIAAVGVRGARLRRLLVFVVCFVVSFLGWWLVSGQRLADIGRYLSGTREIVGGYAPALGGADQYTADALWIALVTVSVVFAIAAGALRRGAARLPWTVLVLWAVAAFVLFKEGFVRSDSSHRPIFFGFAFCALLAFAGEHGRRGRMLLASLMVGVAALWSYQHSPLKVPVPGTRLTAALSQLRTAAVPSARRRAERQLRLQLRQGYGLDPRTLSELRHRTSVAIMEWEFAAVYAYNLRWRPLPTIQVSSAYTSQLDERTAYLLASRSAPQRILRSTRHTFDERNVAWDPPAAIRALLCRYRQLSATPRWQVLARTGDRCGRPTRIATLHARWGQTITVPPRRPDAIMIVRIRGAQPHGAESVESLLYRPQVRHLTLNRNQAFRLVPATAADGLILWVPPALDYTAPFALSQDAHALSVRRGAGPQSGSDRLVYQFDEIRIAPPQLVGERVAGHRP